MKTKWQKHNHKFAQHGNYKEGIGKTELEKQTEKHVQYFLRIQTKFKSKRKLEAKKQASEMERTSNRKTRKQEQQKMV